MCHCSNDAERPKNILPLEIQDLSILKDSMVNCTTNKKG